MQWVNDRTGRFHQRPHYLAAELETECESILSAFLISRHGRTRFPVSTDDLTILMETKVATLDLYADLASEGRDVEGVTDFSPGKQPSVRIERTLTSDSRMSNRLRTTLTHELGHVVLHTFLYTSLSGSLFEDNFRLHQKCKREKILSAAESDWMEWQAGFACGAFLMPATEVTRIVRSFAEHNDLAVSQFTVSSPTGQALINDVCERFVVSREAARVRLLQRGVLTESSSTKTLF